MIIESLTPEQISIFPSIVEKFVNLGLNTQPLNQPQAIKAINLAYQCAGLDQPQKNIFVKSPMIVMMLVQQLTKSKSLIYPINYNNFGCLSLYYTFQQLGLTEETKPMAGLFAMAEECGYIWAFDNLCIVSERPTSIVINDQGQLHNLKGPAISWSDGYGQYYVNGNFVHPDIGERLVWYLNHRKSGNQPKFSLEKELKKYQELNLEVGNQVNNQVRNQVWDQVSYQVNKQISNQVWYQVGKQVKNQVSNQVWFWNRVSNQVWSQVRNQVWNQINSLVWSQISNKS